MKKSKRPLLAKRVKREQGVALIVTLLVLAVMLLASVGMMRSVDTSLAAVGNLAFRQAADAAMNSAVEQVVLELAGFKSGVPITVDLTTNGGGEIGAYYYATIDPTTDDARGIPSAARFANADSNADAAGNTVNTIIERMCTTAGDPTEKTCLGTPGVGSDSPNKTSEYGRLSIAGASFQVFYRVTVRVDGPNNTRTYAQTWIGI